MNCKLSRPKKDTRTSLLNKAQNALQREWGNFPFANWNGICWGLLLQLVQLIKIHFLPHLESFMWEQKFEKNFFKKSPIQTPNGVFFIFKLPFPNGSYRNRVCRALWAWKHPKLVTACLKLNSKNHIVKSFEFCRTVFKTFYVVITSLLRQGKLNITGTIHE